MWADVDEVGKRMGLSPVDSRAYAAFLEEEGWAKMTQDGESAKIRLTLKGFRELEKLRWPRWWRWLNDHSGFVALAGSALFGWLFRLIMP